MTTATTVLTPSSGVFASRGFWETFWRTAGIQSIGLGFIAQIIRGHQPLLAAVLSGLAVLNLMWFAAALKTTLAAEGQDGWGSAVTTSSAIVGGLLFMLILADVLIVRSGGAENSTLTQLTDLSWAALVISSFPRAMLIMAGTFGLWRAKLISNGLFATGVGAVVLVLLGGSTWMEQGSWAPDGVYSRFVSPLIGIAWIAVATRVLLKKDSVTRTGW